MTVTCAAGRVGSPLTREAWIEIDHGPVQDGLFNKSPLTREAWIEMY